IGGGLMAEELGYVDRLIAEYRKSLESWDRQRARLLGDLEHMEEENGQLRREVGRLRREVEFEAKGTNPSRLTFEVIKPSLRAALQRLLTEHAGEELAP